MSRKEDLNIFKGLVRRITNKIFGYQPRGKDDRPRKRRKSRSKRSKAKK